MGKENGIKMYALKNELNTKAGSNIRTEQHNKNTRHT